VSYVAGEAWTDHPTCVSPVIAEFCRRWNDDLGDEQRQALKPYIPRLVGTNTGDADDDRRAWILADWMVRTYLPAWLRISGHVDQATALEGLAELTDSTAWATAKPIVEVARKGTVGVGDASWSAASRHVRSAAGDAAWSAARAAAIAAARAAAMAAAIAAVAAIAAAFGWGYAIDALRPTVVLLQQSAFGLLDRLIAVGIADRTTGGVT